MSSSNTILCGVCQSTIGSNDCTHWSGQGTIDDPFVPTPNIDDDIDNLVRCGPNGIGAFLAPIYQDPPAVHVYGNIAEDEIVPFDTFWPLAFHDKRYDTDNMFDPDEPGRITFNTPGIYDVVSNLRWKKTNDNAATGDLAAFLRMNGAVYLALDSYPVPGGDSFAKFSISREQPFEAGDYVEVGVKQDVLDEDDEPMSLPITIERMSPVFCAAFLRPIEGMTIIGVDTTDANPGGGSGGVGNQYSLNGTQWWETPDHASLDIVGDIDIRIAAAATDWSPGTNKVLTSKNTTDGNQRSWAWSLVPADKLFLGWSSDGATQSSSESTAAPVVSDGQIIALRVSLDLPSKLTKFYTKSTTPETALIDCESDAGWTQLGIDVTGTFAETAIFNSTAPLRAGAFFSGGVPANLFTGDIYALIVKNGINGTTVANPDFYHNNSPFTDDSGRTWTKF